MTATDVDVFDDTTCTLGEGPAWDPTTGSVHWVDINGAVVLSKPFGGGERSTTKAPGVVGAALLTDSGGYLLNLQDGVYLMDAGGEVTELGLFDQPGREIRGNDAKCDVRGRAFLGSMDNAEVEPAGTLYRLDSAGATMVPVVNDLIVSNGIGWSPDNSLMYFIDSLTRRVDVFEYDLETGTPSRRRPFATIDPKYGLPDGLSVDTEGGVWVAVWGSSAVLGHSPDGRLDRIIALPAAQITSCAFVGPQLDRLIVTSASRNIADPGPMDGATFIVDVGVAGLPVAKFAG